MRGRGGLSIALLALLASSTPPKRPLENVPDWWLEMQRELLEIGAFVKNAGVTHDECDVEIACPSENVEKARAIIAKYMTKEAREANAKALKEVEARRV